MAQQVKDPVLSLWHRGLRIRCCHSFGWDLIPGPENFHTPLGAAKKRKRKEKFLPNSGPPHCWGGPSTPLSPQPMA